MIISTSARRASREAASCCHRERSVVLVHLVKYTHRQPLLGSVVNSEAPAEWLATQIYSPVALPGDGLCHCTSDDATASDSVWRRLPEVGPCCVGTRGDDGDDGPRGRSRRTPSPLIAPVRVREAESIKVAAFPEPAAFRNWKSALRQEVAAASGRPDEAFKWFQATDRLSFERLADPGTFPTLDTKLGAGL